jgi:hypothetical protein
MLIPVIPGTPKTGYLFCALASRQPKGVFCYIAGTFVTATHHPKNKSGWAKNGDLMLKVATTTTFFDTSGEGVRVFPITKEIFCDSGSDQALDTIGSGEPCYYYDGVGMEYITDEYAADGGISGNTSNQVAGTKLYLNSSGLLTATSTADILPCATLIEFVGWPNSTKWWNGTVKKPLIRYAMER